ncbi:MAG: class I SAM-dependent methyltransferase [Lewinellaceae bacterium]|nr:class I SAM-dependent methyltransferase [Lewinellaceae bacterium]
MAHQSLTLLSNPAIYREKERLYLNVRSREGRVLSDEAVKKLPFVPDSSPFLREWALRRRSLGRLERYLTRRFSGAPARILDLGCGNGWMANRLAGNPDWKILAMDVNEAELAQGARLFGRENLQFVYADLPGLVSRNDVPGDEPEISFRDTFDLIVLAASVQYFRDLEELVFSLKKCLKPAGEIHIIDSPFYRNEVEKAAAALRSRDYYAGLGVPEMAQYYHHHLWPDRRNMGVENLNNRLFIKVLQKAGYLAHFPWLVLRGSADF